MVQWTGLIMENYLSGKKNLKVKVNIRTGLILKYLGKKTFR